MEDLPINNNFSKQEDFEDFFEKSLCGYAITDSKGIIIRINTRLSGWLNFTPAECKGKKISNFFSVGGKIYYETHLFPLLRMQKYFEEVALELSDKNNLKIPVFINAIESYDEFNKPKYIRFTIFKAIDRITYEQNLLEAKRNAENSLSDEREVAALREQFMAVLGHDLRNPLQAIITGAGVITKYSVNEQDRKIGTVIQRSASRMRGLIDDIMDFARARLGKGLQINLQLTELKPFLLQVIEELQTAWPDRIIQADINIEQPLMCDGARVAQLFSNLLANALIHGSKITPVIVKANSANNNFELVVINNGRKIPTDALKKLFLPFTRENDDASRQGLGLGLFIACEIAKAHNGKLVAESNEQETCFTFTIPL